MNQFTMKQTLNSIIIIAVLFSSCTAKQPALNIQARAEIVRADSAMNQLASSKGFYVALLQYADENVIKPQEGALPVIGKTRLTKYWSGGQVITAISWAPDIANASASGDLGYTFGHWQLQSRDTLIYGNYCTIWKRQADGSWKFVYDGGNNSPKP